ncbi:hypothetical protein [Sporisorium scitamineum]|nr:hypothetical protein [Sporisorium scitamineum]
MRLRAKQKRLVAVSSKAPPPIDSILPITPAVEKSAPVVPAVPIALVHDDEDLGEALEPDPPSAPATAASIAVPESIPQAKQHNRVKSKESNADPETQALLAQSRKQISSISM